MAALTHYHEASTSTSLKVPTLLSAAFGSKTKCAFNDHVITLAQRRIELHLLYIPPLFCHYKVQQGW